MFLNSLKRGPFSSSIKLRIKRNYTHCTQNLQCIITIHPLPTNNSVDKNFQALWSTSKLQQLNALWTISSHFATQIRKLVEMVLDITKTSHGIFNLRSLTQSITNMNIGNVMKRNPNLPFIRISNNKKGMLTPTIEQKCSASIKHRAF
jgi:hypothetical protein